MRSKPIEMAAMTIAIEPLAVTVEQAGKLINISDKSLRALACEQQIGTAKPREGSRQTKMF